MSLINSKTVLELYDMEIHQKISVPNNQKMKTMVKRSIDQKHRFRNFNAGHGRNESGAVMKSRKGLTGVDGGKGICYQWKEKGQCSQGDRCSFRHETQDRAQKPEHTAATPSELTASRGRSVSRKRSIRAKGNNVFILRQPCRYYLKGILARERLVNVGIRPGANSFNMRRVVRLETSVCFRITRLMNNQIKSRRRATSQKEEKAMTGVLWLLRKVCRNWELCITRFRCSRFSR